MKTSASSPLGKLLVSGLSILGVVAAGSAGTFYQRQLEQQRSEAAQRGVQREREVIAPALNGSVSIHEHADGLFSVEARDVDIQDLVRLLERAAGMTVAIDPRLNGRV
ncbi:MAG TPA: hypothetical protein ENG36_03865, partial [Lentisphaerae bacterium]|nr:hypothetical protein [Lentisphaerota bacterium]